MIKGKKDRELTRFMMNDYGHEVFIGIDQKNARKYQEFNIVLSGNKKEIKELLLKILEHLDGGTKGYVEF